MTLTSYFKRKIHLVKADSIALYAAAKDPRTPFLAKVVAFIVLAYLFSPIDLAPDFIPVIGWIDDIVIAWLGTILIKNLIPAEVLQDARLSGAAFEGHLRKIKRGLTAIAIVFALFMFLMIILVVYAIIALIQNLNQ
jgi:uncharacterized membrane protein YkvA (DUF1232 family)